LQGWCFSWGNSTNPRSNESQQAGIGSYAFLSTFFAIQFGEQRKSQDSAFAQGLLQQTGARELASIEDFSRGIPSQSPRKPSSPKFGVSTKSQLGVKSAVGLNSVKRAASEKAFKNQKTAFVCGILIDGLVPKGGLARPYVLQCFATIVQKPQ